MNICILSDRIPPEHAGGAEIVAWRLARGLHARGHRVHVITATHGTAFEDERDGIPCTHLHVQWPERLRWWATLRLPGLAKQLRQVLARIQPDVIHAHNIHGALTWDSLRICREAAPVVFTAHDYMSFTYDKLTVPTPHQPLPIGHNLRLMRLRFNPIRSAFIRRVLNEAVDVRLCLSQMHRRALAANGLHGFEVLYNAVDAADFEAAPHDAATMRARWGVTGLPVVLAAGRLSALKGSHALLRAFEQVAQQLPQARLVLLTRRQDDVTVPESLRERIVWGGWLNGSELAAAYHAADVVATPSIYHDPFLLVNIEAMAARRPVVTTTWGAPPEVVQDGVTGYVVNPLDTTAFADRLLGLLTAPERARQMGEAGHQRVLERFQLSDYLDAHEAIYGRLAGGRE
jgi:glycosyltransferase involved in cell wall biosynthesis